jgi:hypothetical protein
MVNAPLTPVTASMKTCGNPIKPELVEMDQPRMASPPNEPTPSEPCPDPPLWDPNEPRSVESGPGRPAIRTNPSRARMRTDLSCVETRTNTRRSKVAQTKAPSNPNQPKPFECRPNQAPSIRTNPGRSTVLQTHTLWGSNEPESSSHANEPQLRRKSSESSRAKVAPTRSKPDEPEPPERRRARPFWNPNEPKPNAHSN